MAAQTNEQLDVPNPEEVGIAFTKQYYDLLHSSPEYSHKFYKEGSEISRPSSNGEMTSVTTIEGIHQKILSLKYEKCSAEITSAHAQASYKGGISVLVTGILTDENATRKMFTQSFFLAPQDTGYFVQNDIFAYVGENSAAPISSLTVDDISEVQEALVSPGQEVSEKHLVENVSINEEPPNVKETNLSMENGNSSISVEETQVESPDDSSRNDVSCPSADAPPPVIKGDGSKKSFASIVSSLKNNSSPFQVRASPIKVVEKPQAPDVAPGAPIPSAPNGNSPAVKTSSQTVKRYSVFVGNLPLDATYQQLDAAFKTFGPIKHNGIQVRSSKGFCYGFVEFESEASMLAALEAASTMIGNRTAHIEEQRNDSNKGKAPSQGRGGNGFRNNFRAHGNFNGGRGYGRNNFDKKFEFASRNGRSRGGATYNREYQNGSGRGAGQEIRQ
ncbi:hypothetical protein SAY86_031689 [Trapa natans]|uniref:Uncharacterized protein n=1 Tax=Trapa natans TaxID=22666 RepID=A0AAN7LRR8_TRANT|nr:hypothetical protein SAY86_031689 [Trapa natans]